MTGVSGHFSLMSLAQSSAYGFAKSVKSSGESWCAQDSKSWMTCAPDSTW